MFLSYIWTWKLVTASQTVKAQDSLKIFLNWMCIHTFLVSLRRLWIHWNWGLEIVYVCASGWEHENAPMEFSARRVLSFSWIPSEAITPQRLTCREAGSGMICVTWGSSQVVGSQGWRLTSCLHCLLFPVTLAQSFLISGISHHLSGVAVLHS